MPIRPFLAILALAQAAAADPAHEATGRISFHPTEERANCTAVLVSDVGTGTAAAQTTTPGPGPEPVHALSAGHCVPLPPSPSQKLYLGWQPPGRFDLALPVLGARHVAIAPTLHAGISDVALLDLASRPASAVPLLLGPTPRPGETVRVVSYPRGDPDSPRDVSCVVAGRTAATLTLDCPAIAGMSGAPVLVETPRGPAIAAILTARLAPDRSLALIVTREALAGK